MAEVEGAGLMYFCVDKAINNIGSKGIKILVKIDMP